MRQETDATTSGARSSGGRRTMATYIIANRDTRERRVAIADSFREARRLLRWTKAESLLIKKVKTSKYLEDEKKARWKI